jgi:transposase InsO family protein
MGKAPANGALLSGASSGWPPTRPASARGPLLHHQQAKGERFVDTFKTELIADRVWRSRTQLELAVVEYIAWFNNVACVHNRVLFS